MPNGCITGWLSFGLRRCRRRPPTSQLSATLAQRVMVSLAGTQSRNPAVPNSGGRCCWSSTPPASAVSAGQCMRSGATLCRYQDKGLVVLENFPRPMISPGDRQQPTDRRVLHYYLWRQVPDVRQGSVTGAQASPASFRSWPRPPARKPLELLQYLIGRDGQTGGHLEHDRSRQPGPAA